MNTTAKNLRPYWVVIILAAACPSGQAVDITWTERIAGSGGVSWRAIASSDDGTKLVACLADWGSIYTSTDSGATWTERTPNAGADADWTSVVSSADGVKLVAGVIRREGLHVGRFGRELDGKRPGRGGCQLEFRGLVGGRR